MSDRPSEDSPSAIQALSGLFSTSMTELADANQDHRLAISGIAALVACMPGTATMAPERIAAVINLLAQGRPDAEAYRQKLAGFVAMIISTARRLEAAEAVVRTASPVQ